MELLQLRYFYESAKSGSFAKTAEKFMVPPTSVSASVKRLEKELGCPLFDRSSNRVTLNDNGRRFQQSLTVIFDELELATDFLKPFQNDTREIRILVRAIRSTLTEYIIEYKTRHPTLRFKTVFDFSETNYENYDIVVDEQTDRHPEYENFELCCLPLVIKASPRDPLYGKIITLDRLRNRNFITMGEQSNLHRTLIRVCREAGFVPNIVMMANDAMCYEKCIASGLAIGLARQYPNKPKNMLTVPLYVKDLSAHQTVCVYYKKQAAYGNLQNFLDFLKMKSI